MKTVAGYQHSFLRKILNILVNFLATIFLLKKNSVYANEFAELINSSLKEKIIFEGKEIFFKTGHNRINNRVNTFFRDEPMIIDWIKTFDEKDVFLDIGANVGSYTVAALSKGSFVYSIELDLNNSAILFENIFINKLNEKSVILPFGVGDNNKVEKVFYRDFTKGDCLQSLRKETEIPTRKINPFQSYQPIFKLDFLFKELSLTKPNKIKIDVDGNEKLVFEGGKNIILNADEIYYEDIGSKDDKVIIDEILENNFSIFSEMPATNALQGRNDRNILFKKK